MKVFKFGGASVKDADAIRNLTRIIKKYSENLVIVISAMGKTTNALELVLHYYFNQDKNLEHSYQRVVAFHEAIIHDLFPIESEVFSKIDNILAQLNKKLQAEPTMTYNFEYDQIVPFGEILSTTIVSEYLKQSKINCEWIDIRKILKTDNTYREARVNFAASEKLVLKTLIDILRRDLLVRMKTT